MHNKMSIMIVDLLIFPCNSVNVCLVYFEAGLL